MLCRDCPIVFPQGGGMRLEFPIKKDDEVILLASARSIDNWFANGGCQPPSEVGRMHNLSDCFALCGVRNLTRVKSIDGTKVRLINDAGDFYMAFDPTAKAISIQASGGVNINGAQISGAGEVTDALGKVLGTHRHVETGSVTNPPQ
ncbi:MAG: hypothetical protein JSR66_03205 [Proteobacteria bacterium]|nr:hypothetical protein [Pseudomonadota bacterium]